MAFDPDKYAAGSGSAKPKGSGFDPDAYAAAGEDMPMPEQDEGGGMLGDLARGAVSVAKTVDSYTGAPARAGIGAYQDKKGVLGALKATASQFGEDPDTAPTSKSIRQKAGIDLGDKSIITPDSTLDKVLSKIPSTMLLNHVLTRMSPNDAAELGIDMGADVTNLIPVAGLAKRGAKMGIEGIEKGIRGAGRAIEGAGELAGKAGKKVLAGGFGVPEEASTKYLANHGRLKDIVDVRSGMTPIKDDIDATLEPLAQRVGAAKDRVGTAKELRTEELSRLTDAQRESKEALRLAEEQRLGETAARVSGDVQRLNKEVSGGSEKAFQILDQEGVRVPVTPIKSDLTKGIQALESTAITDEQMATVDLLKRYRERLDKFGKDIPGGEAKRLIQSLDREMKHIAPGEVGRLGREDQVLGILRKRFDTPLKASPAYAEQMKGVANDTRLLMGADGMATEGGAVRALQAAQRPSGADRAEVLKLLGERQGQDYLAAVDRSTIPEYQKLKGVLQRVRAARKGGELKQAQSELDAAMSELAPFKGVAPNEYGKSGSEALIRNQLRPKTAGLDQAELVKNLDAKFGKNYSQQIDDLKTISAFDKDYTRGSANTNFWAIASGALGTLIGGPTGGVAGSVTGAAFGRMVVDRFGPQSGRAILDQVAKLRTMAPAEWVRGLRVPESVKSELMLELVGKNASVGVRGTNAVLKPIREASELKNVAEENPQEAPAKGYDKWASQGIEKLGIRDHALAQQLFKDPEGKRLLIEASKLSPGSAEMTRITDQIKRGWVDRAPAARHGKGNK
jgi:hypothetical protein